MPDQAQMPDGAPSAPVPAPAVPRAGSHSRRDFLRGSSLAAASAVISAQAVSALEEAQAAAEDDGVKCLAGEVKLTLNIDGQRREVAAEPRSTLLDVMRNRLDVTGPKRVCDRASCGACTVIVDGQAVYSCTSLAVEAQGKTIETLASFPEDKSGVPHHFVQNDAQMCGYCTPGFVTACKALLDKNPNPTLDDVKAALNGNICRCGTYIGVFQAALDAAKAMKGA